MKNYYNIIEFKDNLPIKSKKVEIWKQVETRYKFNVNSVSEANQVLEQIALDNNGGEFEVSFEYDKSDNIIACIVVFNNNHWTQNKIEEI